jgi:preprotein translocase subunit SecE
MADKEIMKKGPNFFARAGRRMARWAREMRSELKKVVWPTPSQLINNSWVVIVSVIAVGAVIAGIDFVMQTVINALIGVTS